MKKLTLILIMLISFIYARSQEIFKVYFIKGKTEWSTAVNKSEWKQLTVVGTKIYKGDKIKLDQDAVVILFNTIGVSLTLNKPGIYSADDLTVQTANKKSNGLAATYLEYLWDEFNAENLEIDAYSKAYFKDKGNMLTSCPAHIMHYPMNGTLLITKDVMFSWNNDSFFNEYILTIYADPDGKKELCRKTVNSEFFILPCDSTCIHKGQTYYYSITTKSKPECARYSFTVIESKLTNELQANLEKLRAEFTGDNAANILLMASYYEHNKLYDNADKLYQLLALTSQNDIMYQKLYAMFLVRMNNLYEARELLKAKK